MPPIRLTQRRIDVLRLLRLYRAMAWLGEELEPAAEGELASFAWRYNRRHQLQTMIPRFVRSAARTNPMPYCILVEG